VGGGAFRSRGDARGARRRTCDPHDRRLAAACLRLSLRSGKRSLHIREMNRLSCEVQQSTLRLVSGLPATLPPREASCFIASLFLRRSILSVDNCRQPTAPPPVRGCSWPPDGRVVMGAVCLGSFHLNNLMIEFDLCLRRYRSRSLIDRAESSQPSPRVMGGTWP
jgi:hypothetical protein